MICDTCGIDKLPSEYYPSYGSSHICKDCLNRTTKERRAKNKLLYGTTGNTAQVARGRRYAISRRIKHGGYTTHDSCNVCGTMTQPPTSETIGWLPSCACPPDELVSCRVLDPFGGAGTTALVAERLGRDSINIDISSDYIAMAKERLATDASKRGVSIVNESEL